MTPPVDTEDALNANPFNSDSRRNSRNIQLPPQGNARKLLHGDSDVPEWGTTLQIYNQPRSRAGPLPSKSVTDFRKLRQEVAEEINIARRKKFPVPAPSSDAGEFEEWTIVPALRGNGALLNAVEATSNTDVSWVGTLGFPTDALPEGTKLQIEDRLANDYNADVVYVSDQDFSGHYTNFCKVILWPLFHYQVPDDVNSKAYMDRSWNYYYNVNLAFAEKLINNYRKDETIWVHDYHLLLVPSMVRAKRPEAKIGFFLHTAFPSSEIFRCQMKYKALLDGMLGANLVALQLQEYADHFLSTCSRFLQIEATAEGVQLEDRFVNVTAQAIGINPTKIEEVRQSKEFIEAVKTLQEKYEGKQLIVSRDKLDRVHGVRQKLLAYERFLDQSPNRAENTVLLQVLSPNHEPKPDLLARISAIQNRVSRKHGSLTRQPLEMYEQDLSPAQYYAILTMGDALMISTQRDGMNLTGHEFIFCQDGKVAKGHGAAILSEFAGCADILKSEDPRLRVNPWNIQQQADSILHALGMDAGRKVAHWAPLHKTVMELTGGHWFQELDRTLTESHKTQGDRSAASVPRLQASDISKAYDQADHRVFILDYEGTLIAHQTSAGALLTSPHRIIEILNNLMMDPKNVVYVTSGSTHQQLMQIFQTANGVGLIAENGCYLRLHGEADSLQWLTAVKESEMMKWKTELGKILGYYQERLPGSLIEERDCSMEFNFASVEDKKVVDRQVGECLNQINSICDDMRLRAFRKDAETLIIEQAGCDKKTMAEVVLAKLHETSAARATAVPDFLMAAGNDREDEVVFKWANGLGDKGVVRDVFTVSTGYRRLKGSREGLSAISSATGHPEIVDNTLSPLHMWETLLTICLGDTAAKAAMSKGSAGLLSVLEKLAQSSLKDRPVKNPATKRSTRSIPKAPERKI